MRLILIALLILSSSSVTAVHASQRSNASLTPDENAILRIEDTIVKAWLKHDTATIDPLIADDFQSWSFKGQRRGKADLLRSVTNTEETDTKVEDAKVKVYGDAAVYTGRITDRGSHDGKPFSITTCVTHVFLRRNRRWQMVASAEQIVGSERE
ncbi:MAG TPA: nuclear transport factor 2 family protein [Pyrinomonadaceae bacterium]|nr:nuclear transport factor 2 family protein [Pyrinomonadaceae bacterium]